MIDKLKLIIDALFNTPQPFTKDQLKRPLENVDFEVKDIDTVIKMLKVGSKRTNNICNLSQV